MILSSWRFDMCRIYQQVILWKWFLNTFGTIFTLKIQRMDSFNYSKFVFILHKVTFHPKLHMSFGMAHFLAMIEPLGGIHPIAVGETLY